MASFLKEEIKAGLIVIIFLVLLGGSIIFIGGTQFFEKLDNYYVKVMNAAGVEEGAPVKLGGVRIGKVLSIKTPTTPGEPITITAGVKKGTILYKGTKASIAQVGFVGDLYILFSLEKEASGEKYKPGDTIPSEEQVQFAVLMARLDTISQNVNGLLKDINALFSDKNKKEIETILTNTNTAIVSGSGMAKAIEGTAKSVDKTMKTADRTIDVQSQNVETLINNLNRTTEDLRDVLHEVQNKPWSVIYKEESGKGE